MHIDDLYNTDRAGISIAIIWRDEHLIEIKITGGNGSFAGTLDTYISHGHLLKMAETIDGFPISILDKREIVFGTARCTFFCVDKVGHVMVEVSLQASTQNNFNPGSCVFNLRVEPGAIDEFVTQLRVLESGGTETAFLRSG